MNTDIQEVLNKLSIYEPTRPTGYAHALALGSDRDQALGFLVWGVCRLNEDIDLFQNLKNNSCFFRANDTLDNTHRYFVLKSSSRGYGRGTFLFPKLGTILLSKKEIVVPNSQPTYGNPADINEKEELFQGKFTKKDSCPDNYFSDIFIPNFRDRYYYWNHYVISISRHSLFLSKLEFEKP